IAAFAAASAAICAAKGVDLREPLNPSAPAELQPITLPWTSVMVTIVLLNVERIWAIPVSTYFFTRRLRAFAFLVLRALGLSTSFLLVLLSSDCLTRAFARARVRFCFLPSDR